ncbi:hypothetical protein PP459_gp041 [Streptomyces phage Wakanda]|uniref:Uncharacterized protein n=2 Tax=Wakandavirus TaxID=3044854 RepID=A0A6G8R3I6_9CAUD|nr:hypothetical protein PP459_gp041 [Streptomyces phage Wakanda]YP_010652515.1 hypothetical protein PP460_gp043 [Streptomyces phage Muntaha]QIN94192.1 hypothetical protein SEA_WAKANDA_232 [Streptomyces phage Wakanda]QIN94759.1 hypothetical protein SEA_MUNTAHA_236 [Streptomyces phage Muntaha]
MKVSARIVRKSVSVKGQKKVVGGISVKRLGRESQSHKAGTVIMTNVRFGKTVCGDLLEENDKALMPRSQKFLAVSSWPKARYIASLGHYVDTETGSKVTSAAAVYMVGSTIYYM